MTHLIVFLLLAFCAISGNYVGYYRGRKHGLLRGRREGLKKARYYKNYLKETLNLLEDHDWLEAAECREWLGWENLTTERMDELHEQRLEKRRRERYGDE